MLVERLKSRFGYDVPIFTDEILELFSQYTKAYVFRLIRAAEEKKELVQIDIGTYYLPQMTPFGLSVITASDIARKKYIQDDDETYGIYSGLTLQNAFSLTTQISNVPEIVTNRASSRCRKIAIDGMQFVLRKSRIEITSENVCAYRVLQLFSENNGVEIGAEGKKKISEYMVKNGVTQGLLMELVKSFPARTLQNLVYSGVLYAVT